MEIHRPRPDGAASRQGNPRLPHPRHKGTEHQDRGPHGPDQIVGGLAARDPAGVDPQGLLPFHLHTEAFEKLLDRLDIHEIGNVVKGIPSLDQKR